MSTHITNNTITSAGDNGFSAGIVAISGDTGGGDNNTLCLNITGNNVSTPNIVPPAGHDGNDYVFVSFAGTDTQIAGAGAGGLTELQIDTFITTNDSGAAATVADDVNVFVAGGTFTGAVSCPL